MERGSNALPTEIIFARGHVSIHIFCNFLSSCTVSLLQANWFITIFNWEIIRLAGAIELTDKVTGLQWNHQA
jgi:hypothetical protein